MRFAGHTVEEFDQCGAVLARDGAGSRVYGGVIARQLVVLLGSRAVAELDEHSAAVVGMRPAVDPSGALQPVDEHRDGARREQQPFAELALRQGATFEVLERVEIGHGQTGRARKCQPQAIAFESDAMELAADLWRGCGRHGSMLP
jgi:hypothetical protein